MYRGERLPSGEARALPENPEQKVGVVNFRAMGVQLYIVTGTEPDVKGADGEPLLKNARIWRKAK